MRTLLGVAHLGWCCLFGVRFINGRFRPTLYQVGILGQRSIGLVVITGLFTGVIIAWQAAFQLQGIAPLGLVSGQIARVLVMEIGPVLTGLVLAGRLGTAITAELGAMVLSYQVDALRSMAIKPEQYLILPRVYALVLMGPGLTWIAVVMGLIGAGQLLQLGYNFPLAEFFTAARLNIQPTDLMIMPFKGLVFGLGIGLIGGWHGLTTTLGVEGLRDSTTRAFVDTTMFILSGDLCIALLIH